MLAPRIVKLKQVSKTRNPPFEVLAPAGYRFTDGPHSFIAWDRAEAEDYLTYEFEKCPPDCDCHEV